jgi:hypothetical protein
MRNPLFHQVKRMMAVPRLIHKTVCSESAVLSPLNMFLAAVGMATPIAAKNNKELHARLLVALKVCTL